MRRPRLAAAGSVTGIAAALVAGYAAAGPTGLIDVASVTTLGVLVVARGTVRGEEPASVRPGEGEPGRRPAVRAADFPAFARFASDVEWARMSRRHYEHVLRPALARLAEALGRARAAELAGTSDPPIWEADGPGVGRATLERIITTLEER